MTDGSNLQKPKNSVKSWITLPRLCVGRLQGNTLSTSIGNGILYQGAHVPLTVDQIHYLTKVTRIRPVSLQNIASQDPNVRVFDGVNGEWTARLISADPEVDGNEKISRKRQSQANSNLVVECIEQIRDQEQCITVAGSGEPLIIFGAIKKERVKLLLEKCTELGAAAFIPVSTARSEASNVARLSSPGSIEKMHLQVLEASEQCERLTVPRVVLNSFCSSEENAESTGNCARLKELLDNWGDLDGEKNKRLLLVCRERGSGEHTRPILEMLNSLAHSTNGSRIAFLIGPEGGWSPYEESLFDNQEVYPFIKGVSLGGLVLRAETAAIIAAGAWNLVFSQCNAER